MLAPRCLSRSVEDARVATTVHNCTIVLRKSSSGLILFPKPDQLAIVCNVCICVVLASSRHFQVLKGGGATAVPGPIPENRADPDAHQSSVHCAIDAARAHARPG